MRAIFSTVLIILASSTLGKEATLEEHLKDDTDLSQVSRAFRINRYFCGWSVGGYTTVKSSQSYVMLRPDCTPRMSFTILCSVCQIYIDNCPERLFSCELLFVKCKLNVIGNMERAVLVYIGT